MKTKFILAAMALTAATTFTTTAQAQLTRLQQFDQCQEASEVAGTVMYHWQQKGEVAKLKRSYLTIVAGDHFRTFAANVIFDNVVTIPRLSSDAERVGITRQYMRDFLRGCLAEIK